MLTRTTRDIERVLGQLDPAQHEPAQHEPAQYEPAQYEPAQYEPAQREPAAGTLSTSTQAERAAMLLAILAVTAVPVQPARGRRVPVRRLVLVSTALVAVAAVFVIVRPQPSPVYAATPPMLQYVLTVDAPAASTLLGVIAVAAERFRPRGRGPYEYIHAMHWSLSSPILDKGKEWGIQPGETQRWLRTDNASGRTITSGPGQQDAHDTYHEPGTLRGTPLCLDDPPLPNGERPDCPIERLADRAVLTRELNIDERSQARSSGGRVSPFGQAVWLAFFRVMPPVVLAQMWRIFAGMPGIAYSGRVIDRAGRVGEAFSINFDGGLGPAVDTIIADPTTGELLGYERWLKQVTNPEFHPEFHTAGMPVRLRTPAVIDYWVFLASERRETTT
jgi:hypothetical protein